MKVTLIIVTYNRPDALGIILKSIRRQHVLPDEVIIADDGSGPETAELIREAARMFPVPLKQVWQEHKDFRAAAIRNRAIRESSGDFLIFSDGDLVFHPKFVYDYIRRSSSGTALIGSRLFLNPEATLHILKEGEFRGISPLVSRSIAKNRLNSVRIPIPGIVVPTVNFSLRMRGGLLGVFRTDIGRVNGWNESFTGWGLEDTELVARLFNSGIRFKKMKFAGLAYHLWHPEADRNSLGSNRELLQKTVNEKLSWCSQGIVTE